MKSEKEAKGPAKAGFARAVSGLWPVAHGTLSRVNKRCGRPGCGACRSGEGHPSWIFTFRRDGRQRCMHVQPRHAEAVRQAIENGRLLEEAILGEGIAFIERLRGQE